MKVWISKYSLSQGVYEIEVEDCGDGIVRTKEAFSVFFHEEGKDWHKTKESALAKAEEMRQRKIESLKKQISKLEKIEFIL